MDRQIINFSANEQSLIKTSGTDHYAGNVVRYIEAHFDLGANWSGYDSVRAIWRNKRDVTRYSTVLNSEGVCVVPYEVLTLRGDVCMNLVGSIVEGDVLVDRITTYPICALTVDVPAMVDGSDPASITPSEYEQFVASVRNDANRAEAGAESAEASASRAESEADQATASAQASEASALRASGYASDAQASERNASEYAQNAQNYATDAESAKDDAIDARDEIRSMRANAETLEPNQSATASYSNGVLTLGIPKGQKGDTGDTGTSAGFGTVSASVDDSVGTPSVEVTASGEDTAKNFAFAFHNLKGAKGDKGDTGTVPDLDLILPTDTASGDIASISDGQSIIPVESLKVTLEPIQDLHGYDKPWAGGAGKNIVNWVITENTFNESYNGFGQGKWQDRMDIPASWVGKTITYSAHFDTGSANNQAAKIWLYKDSTYLPPFKAGNYIVANSSGVSSLTITIPSSEEANQIAFGLGVGGGTKVSKPQVEIGSTATSYEPYSNICPISGHTECVTSVSGVNVWDEEWEVGSYDSDGEEYPSTARIRSKNYISVLPNTTYYINCSAMADIHFYDADHVHIIPYVQKQNNTFVIPSNAEYVRFCLATAYGTTYNHDISINYPSTDTEYHAYDGNTYTTTLGRTVYGGTLDVVSGELVVDRVYAQLDTETTYRAGGQARFDDYWVASVMSIPNISGNIKSESSVISSISPKDMVYNRATVSGFCKNIGSPYPIFALMDSDSGLDGSATLAQIQEAMNALIHANPPQLVYELATPQTIQLTPQQIMLLTGNNNVWSDGSVVMVYNADVGLYIDKKLGTSGTRTLSMTRTLAKSEDADTKTDISDTKSDAELTKSDNIQLAED